MISFLFNFISFFKIFKKMKIRQKIQLLETTRAHRTFSWHYHFAILLALSKSLIHSLKQLLDSQYHLSIIFFSTTTCSWSKLPACAAPLWPAELCRAVGTRALVLESLFYVYFRKWCSGASQIAFHDFRKQLQNHVFSRIVHLAKTRAPVIAAH